MKVAAGTLADEKSTPDWLTSTPRISARGKSTCNSAARSPWPLPTSTMRASPSDTWSRRLINLRRYACAGLNSADSAYCCQCVSHSLDDVVIASDRCGCELQRVARGAGVVEEHLHCVE